MIRAVIFDVDGTLVDTTAMHARAWQESFEYFGRSFPIEKIRSQIGKGDDQIKPVFLTEEGIAAFGSDPTGTAKSIGGAITYNMSRSFRSRPFRAYSSGW